MNGFSILDWREGGAFIAFLWVHSLVCVCERERASIFIGIRDRRRWREK